MIRFGGGPAHRLTHAGLTSAVTCAALAAASFVLFVLSRGGQAIDAAALGATLTRLPLQWQLDLFGTLRWGLVPLLALAATALGGLALARGRWPVAAVTLACSWATVGVAEALKWLLERPDLGTASYGHNTWPSGHAAAVCALALACQALSPGEWSDRARHRLAWVLVAIVVLAGYASVASYAHRPSDTIGAILIAGAVFALARAPEDASPTWRRPRVHALVPVAVVGAVVLLLLADQADAGTGSSLRAGASLLGHVAAAGWVLSPRRAPAQESARRISRAAAS